MYFFVPHKFAGIRKDYKGDKIVICRDSPSEGLMKLFFHYSKWEIIKHQINNGYKNFDLGDVVITNNQITKTGYNGNIIEYTNSFDLVINELLYNINNYGKKAPKEKNTQKK